MQWRSPGHSDFQKNCYPKATPDSTAKSLHRALEPLFLPVNFSDRAPHRRARGRIDFSQSHDGSAQQEKYM
jgi:hypothetical protein